MFIIINCLFLYFCIPQLIRFIHMRVEIYLWYLTIPISVEPMFMYFIFLCVFFSVVYKNWYLTHRTNQCILFYIILLVYYPDFFLWHIDRVLRLCMLDPAKDSTSCKFSMTVFYLSVYDSYWILEIDIPLYIHLVNISPIFFNSYLNNSLFGPAGSNRGNLGLVPAPMARGCHGPPNTLLIAL